MNEAKNLACPFCECPVIKAQAIMLKGYPAGYNAMCDNCESTGPYSETPEGALEKWNDRAGGREPEPSKTGGVKALASATGYEATLRTIKDAPLTWLGGILACCVEECVRRKFFRDTDAISRFVNRVLEKGKPHNDGAMPRRQTEK